MPETMIQRGDFVQAGDGHAGVCIVAFVHHTGRYRLLLISLEDGNRWDDEGIPLESGSDEISLSLLNQHYRSGAPWTKLRKELRI